jgi:RNA-binding protein YlmH
MARHITEATTQNLSTLRIDSLTVTVPSVSRNYAEVVVSVPAISSGDLISASFLGTLDTENDIQSIHDDNIRVYAIAEAGQIRFCFTSDFPFMGPFLINYFSYTP